MAEMPDETKNLLRRIDALQRLLACYRTQSRPTNKVHDELTETAKLEREIRDKYVSG